MDTNQKAIFAAGCFWGIEAAFQKTSGVVSTRVGYIGGALQNPTYEQVCAGNSGHAEAVELIFDEKAVSYSALLDIFWRLHNPTQLNRQGRMSVLNIARRFFIWMRRSDWRLRNPKPGKEKITKIRW